MPSGSRLLLASSSKAWSVPATRAAPPAMLARILCCLTYTATVAELLEAVLLVKATKQRNAQSGKRGGLLRRDEVVQIISKFVVPTRIHRVFVEAAFRRCNGKKSISCEVPGQPLAECHEAGALAHRVNLCFFKEEVATAVRARVPPDTGAVERLATYKCA